MRDLVRGKGEIPNLAETTCSSGVGGVPHFGDVEFDYSSGNLQLGDINSVIQFDFHRLQLAGPPVRLDERFRLGITVT